MTPKELKKIAYIGAFLTTTGHGYGLNRARACCTVLENLFCHHLTLLFKPHRNPEGFDRLLPWIGKEIEITVTGIALGTTKGRKAQAFICTLPEGVYCANENPHITIATGMTLDGKPVSPATSNEVLANPHATIRLAEPLEFMAPIGLYTHKNEIIYDSQIENP
jgi:hypothetical protein